MTSDNDGDSVVASSGCSGCPSPAAPGAKTGRVAGAAKGILVHNNKKSGNTNRVSFVTNSSATTSSSSSSSSSSSPSSSLSPSPSVERSKKKYNRRSAADDDGDDALQSPYHVRSGRRPTGFGVKSYLHEFYDDPDGRESFQGGGGCGDDDFKYLVEPEIHWYRHCSGVYVVLGLAVMTVGAIALAAGHLIPAKDPVVGRSTHMEVIDRRAVSFNDHLASCRYIGSVVFAVGVVFTVVRFWASVIRGGGGFGFGGGQDCEDRAAKKLRAVEERPTAATAQRPQTVRIPITGTLENVQPDPTAIRLQFADSS